MPSELCSNSRPITALCLIGKNRHHARYHVVKMVAVECPLAEIRCIHRYGDGALRRDMNCIAHGAGKAPSVNRHNLEMVAMQVHGMRHHTGVAHDDFHALARTLDGIELADSVAVSAHKWLFQPKESAFVFFRDAVTAHSALSFGGAYLAAPKIGLLGSHGATAVPLFATLWAWGRDGLASRLYTCMTAAEKLAAFVEEDQRLELLGRPDTGVVVWRPRDRAVDQLWSALPIGLASKTTVAGSQWLRCVAANPSADVDAIIDAVQTVI